MSEEVQSRKLAAWGETDPTSEGCWAETLQLREASKNWDVRELKAFHIASNSVFQAPKFQKS